VTSPGEHCSGTFEINHPPTKETRLAANSLRTLTVADPAHASRRSIDWRSLRVDQALARHLGAVRFHGGAGMFRPRCDGCAAEELRRVTIC
jgi:hypothetical protein